MVLEFWNTTVASNITGPDDILSTRECKRSHYLLLIIIVEPLISVLAIVWNSVFLLTVAKTSSLQRLSIKLMAALAVANLFQATIGVPASVADVFYKYHYCEDNIAISTFSRSVSMTFALMGMETITIIAVDQYLAIIKPFFYQSTVRPARVFAILGFLWIYAITSAAVINIGKRAAWRLFAIHSFSTICISFAIIIYVYCVIYITVQKTAKRIAATNPAEAERIRQRARAAKTGFLVFLAFTCSFMPIVAYQIYRMSTTRHIIILSLLARTVAFCNPLWDCLIYYWRLKTVRAASRRLLSSLCSHVNQFTSKRTLSSSVSTRGTGEARLLYSDATI